MIPPFSGIGLRIGAAMLCAALWTGCMLRAPETRQGSALEVMYRLRQRSYQDARGSLPTITTSAYRDILGKSLFSRCRMVPSDSQMFDLLMKRCGIVRAVLKSSARLFLERAAQPAYLRPVRLEGRLRWLDLPGERPCD